jgi:hypothetical protein
LHRIIAVAVVVAALLPGHSSGSNAPTRQLLSAKLNHSSDVIRFFEQRGRYLRAPRHTLCSGVPWTRSCLKARTIYRQHKREARLLKRQLWLHLPSPNDWQLSVKVAQRAFPNTEGWALSCSGAEGGHSRWVIYGGGPYYTGVEFSGVVGGPMQYRWGTFKGHYRHALDSLRERGFKVDLPPPDDVAAWRSYMAQALAATWARWSGNDDSHWSASFGNGC